MSAAVPFVHAEEASATVHQASGSPSESVTHQHAQSFNQKFELIQCLQLLLRQPYLLSPTLCCSNKPNSSLTGVCVVAEDQLKFHWWMQWFKLVRRLTDITTSLHFGIQYWATTFKTRANYQTFPMKEMHEVYHPLIMKRLQRKVHAYKKNRNRNIEITRRVQIITK